MEMVFGLVGAFWCLFCVCRVVFGLFIWLGFFSTDDSNKVADPSNVGKRKEPNEN